MPRKPARGLPTPEERLESAGQLPRETLSSLNSQELLFRARDGDREAAGRLFARYLPTLHRWLHRRLPRGARGVLETSDLVQDAVLHTLRNIGSFEPQGDGALLRYLRRALLNRIRDQFRYASRHPDLLPLDEHHPDSSPSPFEFAVDQETRERYGLALRRLRPKDRTAIIARLELGYSYEQLALVLHTPTAEAARLAVRRALLRFAREMTNV